MFNSHCFHGFFPKESMESIHIWSLVVVVASALQLTQSLFRMVGYPSNCLPFPPPSDPLLCLLFLCCLAKNVLKVEVLKHQGHRHVLDDLHLEGLARSLSLFFWFYIVRGSFPFFHDSRIIFPLISPSTPENLHTEDLWEGFVFKSWISKRLSLSLLQHWQVTQQYHTATELDQFFHHQQIEKPPAPPPSSNFSFHPSCVHHAKTMMDANLPSVFWLEDILH